MKAVVLTHTGKPEVLKIMEVPIPKVIPGWVLIKVKGFGLNRSELMMRQFEANASYIKLPRILGIECVGEVENPSDSHFKIGQKVIALMGGMGRTFDGSYAEYALIPSKNVFSVESKMSWSELAAIPESYFTAWGSLFNCLQLKKSETILIRGGTSSAGLAAIQLAKSIGSQVIASTRNLFKSELLYQQGADYVLIDDGSISEQLKSKLPKGIDKILELVGASTLFESMSFLKQHGIICMTGILGEKHTLDRFYPIKDIPSGVYLTAFSSNNPTQEIINEIFIHIDKHFIKPKIGNIFTLNEISYAHQLMEENKANGKIVIIN